jgi:hypothetical protein
MTLSARLVSVCFVVIASSVPCRAQTMYNMIDYWVTPPNKYATLQTTNWNNTITTGQHSFWRGTFMGKNVVLQGPVFAAPPPDSQRYDVFEVGAEGVIYYWGTFGNNLPNTDTSHVFGDSNGNPTRIVWMNPTMSAGPPPPAQLAASSVVSGAMKQYELTNINRAVTNSEDCTYSVKVIDHYASWANTLDPNGTVWNDVLYVQYQQVCQGGTITEQYWLAKGVGTIAFITDNSREPSHVKTQYALPSPALQDCANQPPLVPWYDPFNWRTHVDNGFFENPVTAAGGAPLSSHTTAWTGYSGTLGAGTANTADVGLATFGGPIASYPNYATLNVNPSPGWDLALSAPIPVTSNTVYRLTGWVRRGNSADNVYLDMDDLTTDGVQRDHNLNASSVGNWDFVAGDYCVGSATSIQVRCVRDTGNAADGGCDGITIQRIDGTTLTTSEPCGSGEAGGSGGGTPGCYLNAPDGICERSEWQIAINPTDGTEVRTTTCPEDCHSCGEVGGDYCYQNQPSVCPTGYRYLQWTYDCSSCCESCTSSGCPTGACGWQTDNCGAQIYCGSCLPSCGTLGGNYCSQTAACPKGFSSLGPSNDPCVSCCRSLPSCGTMGGNYCSQTASCPAYYSALGQSYDCAECCSCHPHGCPGGSCGWQSDGCGNVNWCGTCLSSCGQMGGNYCSQGGSCPGGYDSLGRSTDCQTCCRQGPSCGARGGNYCSQNGSCPAGYGDLGQTWDCNHCCQN